MHLQRKQKLHIIILFWLQGAPNGTSFPSPYSTKPDNTRENRDLYCSVVSTCRGKSAHTAQTHTHAHAAHRMPRGQLTAHRWKGEGWPVNPRLRVGILRALQATSSRLLPSTFWPIQPQTVTYYILSPCAETLRQCPWNLKKWAFSFLKYAKKRKEKRKYN